MNQPLQIVDALVYRLNEHENNMEEISVSMWDGSRKFEDRADGARRVMACVNACAKTDTETLETYFSGGDLPASGLELEIVKEQRDGLLDAIKVAVMNIENDSQWQAHSDLCAAFLKVEQSL